MADVYGVDYTNAFQTTPQVNAAAANAGGRVRAITDTITFAGDAAGTVAYLGGTKLPDGATIIGWTVDSADLGTGNTVTLKAVGTTTKTLSAALAVDSGASVHTETDTAGFVPQTADGESAITLTTAVAASTGLVSVIVFYVND
jgi:hypothetical protein